MGYNAPKQTVSQFQLKGRYARQYLSFAGKSSKGAFHDLTYAKQCADKNPGYYVFDPDGKATYPVTQTSSVPYAVRVSISNLNIRKGPGTNYAKTGQHTGNTDFYNTLSRVVG